MLRSMDGWWRPGPISVGLALAALAAWVLWFRDSVRLGPFFLHAELITIAVFGAVGAVIAYGIEIGWRRARARSQLRRASPEGQLQPHVWLSRAHETLREVVANANDEARALRHNYVGSEHLLLGAIRTDTTATRAARRFGVSFEAARDAIGRIIPTGSTEVEVLGISPRAKDALMRASRVAGELGHPTVRVPHLWLGILDLDDDAIASRVLIELGADRDGLRAALRDEAVRSSDDERRWPRTDIRPSTKGPDDPPDAVRIGSSVMISGTGPEGLSGADAGDPARQADRCLELIDALLERAGSRMSDLYRLRIYLRDASAQDAVRTACLGRLREHLPAMTFVVAGLPEPGWAVMMEGEAIIGQHGAPSA
jgi:enamine deaminase RidA (YjgF/YER057c/UK114 family)